MDGEQDVIIGDHILFYYFTWLADLELDIDTCLVRIDE